MFENYGADLTTIFPSPVLDAEAILASNYHTDIFDFPTLWEGVVATIVGGQTTRHQEKHDVEVNIWGKGCRLEVKFSRAFSAKFSPIRGKDWSRTCLKWVNLHGASIRRPVDAFVLIGLDQLVYAWVIPACAIPAGINGVTITAPSSRISRRMGRLDGYLAPFDALLPCIARACHNSYDAPVRRAGILERQRARSAAGDLFDGDS